MSFRYHNVIHKATLKLMEESKYAIIYEGFYLKKYILTLCQIQNNFGICCLVATIVMKIYPFVVSLIQKLFTPCIEKETDLAKLRRNFHAVNISATESHTSFDRQLKTWKRDSAMQICHILTASIFPFRFTRFVQSPETKEATDFG